MLMIQDDIFVHELPPGYRFSPTDIELIAYLFLRILGIFVLHQVVKDTDAKKFYSEHPSAIGNEDEREWYLFIHDKNKIVKKEGELQKLQLVNIFKSILKDVFGLRTSFCKLEDLIITRLARNRLIGKDEYFEEERREENIPMVDEGEEEEEEEEEKEEQIITRLARNRLVEEEEERREENIPMVDHEGEEEKEEIREVGNGIGVWKSIGKEDPIYDKDGMIFAFKTHFVYYKRFQNKDKKTHWRMEQYQLTTGRRRDQKITGCVLGRITRGTNYSNDR